MIQAQLQERPENITLLQPLAAKVGAYLVVFIFAAAVAIGSLSPPTQLVDTPGPIGAWPNSGPSKLGDVWTNSAGMAFAYIPSGTFLMGSPPGESGRYTGERLHRVTISKSYLMGTTDVTVRQFEAFVSDANYRTDAEKLGWAYAWRLGPGGFDRIEGASWRNPGFDQGPDRPVVEVSWNDAVAFCQWLNSREPGHYYHLPTEAQWEYACRAGTQTAYPWGNQPSDGRGWCNVGDLSLYQSQHLAGNPDFLFADGFAFTSPVKSLRPNAWGLYDMIGDVRQWVCDWYGPYPPGDAVDPDGPSAKDATRFLATDPQFNGPIHVPRGGCWWSGARDSRCAYRSYNHSTFAPTVPCTDEIGFRVALDR